MAAPFLKPNFMTYCEKTDHDEFALHVNSKELNEVLISLERQETKEGHGARLVQARASSVVLGRPRGFLPESERGLLNT